MGLSNARAAKRVVYERLRAGLAENVGVWHSAPNIDRHANANVIVGRVEVDQEWGSIGAQNPRRDENILITVRVEVFTGGTDEFKGEDRAWEIAEKVQTVLSADLTLGGTVRYARPDRIEVEPEPFSDGRLCVLSLIVRCRADNH